MKKYWILFGITVLAIAGIILGEDMTRPVVVKTRQLTEQTVQTRVNCTGKITEANRQGVYTDIPVIAKNICVQEGDYVQKGDLLFEINREATVEALAGYLGQAEFSSEELEMWMKSMKLPQIPSGWMSQFAGEELISLIRTMVQGNAEQYTAPVSGYVRSIHVGEEELNQTAVPAMVLTLSDNLQVELSVNESKISQIRRGQKVFVTGVGFRGSEYEGVVSSVANYARQEYTGSSVSTNVKVTVRMEEYGADFKSGLTAQAAIVVDEKEDAVLIPYEAVRCEKDGREYVYLVRNGRAEKQYVEAEEEYAEGFCAEEGIVAGDLLITEPDRVKEGQRVLAVMEETKE